MYRRTLIQGVVSTSILALAGCAGTDESTRDETEAATQTPTSTPSATQQGEVLVDEVVYTRNRYPFDLNAGQRLIITVDVKRSGPLIVDVANRDTRESIFRDTVETQAELEIPIENDGTHYVTFQGASEASVEVVLVGSND